MITVHERQESERDWYSKVFDTERVKTADLILDDEWLNDVEAHHMFFFRLMNCVKGKQILIIGAGGIGGGKVCTWFVNGGANVVGVDVSPEGIQLADLVLKANGVKADLKVCGAERMEVFEDESFHLISAYGVLHHLDLDLAAKELNRVLKEGGILVSVDAWGGNPILQFARKNLWYPGKNRSPLETPLTKHDIRLLGSFFNECEVWYFGLFGALSPFLSKNRPNHIVFAKLCAMIDAKIFAVIPAMKTLGRSVVGRFVKGHANGERRNEGVIAEPSI